MRVRLQKSISLFLKEYVRQGLLLLHNLLICYMFSIYFFYYNHHQQAIPQEVDSFCLVSLLFSSSKVVYLTYIFYVNINNIYCTFIIIMLGFLISHGCIFSPSVYLYLCECIMYHQQFLFRFHCCVVSSFCCFAWVTI